MDAVYKTLITKSIKMALTATKIKHRIIKNLPKDSKFFPRNSKMYLLFLGNS